ncbi:MAG: AAA family ATPase [Planctomycetota bacterium]
MKVLAIRGENLASLAGAFELDLSAEPLGGSGLFAVTGPTGAGKSTLLDALCLALYDRTPRLGGRGGTPVGYRHPRDADDLRSHDPRGILRRGAGEGFAEVDFVGRGGRRYRATWRVRRARGRPDGRLQPQSLELTDLDEAQPLGGHTKTETLAAIEQAVGLDYDAFARSVLLAQGEFAAFLRADAADRAALLERLSGSALYGRVSSLAHARAREAREAVRLLEARGEAVTLLDPERREALTRARDAAEVATGEAREALSALEQRQRALAERDLAREESRAAEAALGAARTAHEAGATLRAACAEAERALPLRPLRDAALSSEAARVEAVVEAEAGVVARQAAEEALAQAQRAAQSAEEVLRSTRESNADLARAVARARALDAQLAVARVEQTRAQDAQDAAVRARGAAVEGLEAARAALHEAQAAADAAAQALGAQVLGAGLARTRDAWEPSLARFLERAQARERALAVRAERLQAVDGLRGADAARAEELAEALAAREQAQEALEAVPPSDPGALERLAEARRRSATLAQASAEARDARELAEAAAAGMAAAEEALTRVRADADAARATLAQAREEVQAGRGSVAAIERTLDLTAHRADLEPHHPCPLCGATEHPYAQALPPLDRLLGEERERLRAAEARASECATLLEALAGDLARESERRGMHESRAAEASARRDAAAAIWSAAGDAPWPVEVELPAGLDDPGAPEALERLSQGLAQAEAAQLVRAEAHAQARTRREAADVAVRSAERQAREARAGLEAAVAGLAEIDAEVGALDEGLEQDYAELVAVWPESLEPDGLRREPAAFAASLRRQVEAALAAEREAARLGTALEQARARCAEAEVAHAERVQALAACESALRERAQRVEALRAERGAALEGEADAREARGREAEAASLARHDEARRALADAERELARASERTSLAQRNVEQATRRAETARSQAQAALASAGLTQEAAEEALARDPAWLPQRRAELERLEQELRARERAATLAADHLRRLEARLEEGRTGDELVAALEAARGEARARSAEWARLEGQLGEDARARERHASLAAELVAARDAARPWLELGELIGSHDGSKLRNFAQSLTLEALLGRANMHLAHLAPRYALERVGGQDLDLQVLDRDLGDEVRPLRSLSGGETFLVSLALALGLAGVRAADTRVESLFIDEGFGSLDPASQDLALEALDALQARGLQVGVITHVRALAERVAARVEVQPVAQGESRLRVSSGLALV